MLRVMSDAWSVEGESGSPVECRHCGSPGTIRPNPAGRGRPLFSWRAVGCQKAEHEATSESMAAATRDWWKQEKARRRAGRSRPTAAPTVPDAKKRGLTPAAVLGLVLFLLVALWLLAGAPTG